MERDPFEGVDRDAEIDTLLEDPCLVVVDGVVECVACRERIVSLAAAVRVAFEATAAAVNAAHDRRVVRGSQVLGGGLKGE